MNLKAIQAEFDQIARLVADEPDRPERYEAFLLAQLPPPCGTVLEVGCGAGGFARALAARGALVSGVDASPEMIRLARQRTRAGSRVEFVCGDSLEQRLPSAHFDAVVSVATLHHLPAAPALSRMAALVRPGGVLVVHDLRAPSGPSDWIRSGCSALGNGDAVWWLVHALHERRAVRAAWRAHGSGERYLSLPEIRALYPALLPGARLHRHPLWRYTAVWTRPDARPAAETREGTMR